jgi:hypothetical protein
MKTGFYIILTSVIFAGLYFAAINMENPIPVYAVGVAILVLFIWGLSRRSKKAAQRAYRERMFQQHMRMTLRNQWH